MEAGSPRVGGPSGERQRRGSALPGAQPPAAALLVTVIASVQVGEKPVSATVLSFQKPKLESMTEVIFNNVSFWRRPGPLPAPASVLPGFDATTVGYVVSHRERAKVRRGGQSEALSAARSSEDPSPIPY